MPVDYINDEWGHIHPNNDLIEHNLDAVNELYSCPCNPFIIEMFGLVIHHAMDAREHFGAPPPMIIIKRK